MRIELIDSVTLFVSVESKADEVIEQLLKTNIAQKQRYVSSVISSLYEDIPIKPDLHQQKILGSFIFNL